jgi:mannosyltransferase OCH1-like enzyme
MQKLTADYWLKKILKLKEKAIFQKNVIQNKNFSEKPKIPRIVHQICLSNKGIMPDKYKNFKKSWAGKYPEWEYKFWGEKEINEFGLKNKKLYNQTNNHVIKSNIAKYEILYRFGGLCIDPYFEYLKNFDLLHHYCDFYAGICIKNIEFITGFIGACPKNPRIKEYIENITQKKQKPLIEIIKTESSLLTRCFFITTNKKCDNNLVILPTTPD